MLRPPAGLRTSTPLSTSAAMSRSAASEEHFAIFAHFDVVRLPSKPSRRRLICLRPAREVSYSDVQGVLRGGRGFPSRWMSI